MEEMARTVALVLVKTELGMAKEVADAAAKIEGVCWTLVVTGPYDVVVAVKVDDNSALGDLVVEQLQRVPGVRNPGTLVATQSYRPAEGNEMFP